MTWWVQSLYESGGVVPLFSWIFWVIASICLHELAHGVVAIRNGDNTPRALGHMTLNPVVHMGMTSLILFAVAGIAFGMMPTDPSRYRNRRWGTFSVAIAGPLTNLILAFVCLTSAGIWEWMQITDRVDMTQPFSRNLAIFLWLGGFLNLLLAVFNMLPVPPLDGSRVLGSMVPRIERLFDDPQVRLYGMLAMLIIFFTAINDPLQAGLAQFARDYKQATAKYLLQRDVDAMGAPTGDPALPDNQ
jgi:Zn-dependent protease